MDEELKEQMRSELWDRYGVDIEEAVVHFSTSNYAFVFPGKPFMIRVSMTPKRSRQEILSELMWVDDLKSFKSTICEPSLSQRGNLLEEFEIDGKTYRASMFRTARGTVKEAPDITPMFFICVGDLLGTIHEVSTEEGELGMHYKRKTLADSFTEQKERAWDKLDSRVQERIAAIEAEVNALPESPGVFGICHGDFHINNFFVEENNVWVFDFDGCCYADYLYDAASFIQSCYLYGYGAGKDCRETLYGELLPYFRIGYELNHPVPDSYWGHLELFLAYRTAFTLLMLAQIDSFGGTGNLDQMKAYFTSLLLAPNVLDGMTAAAEASKETESEVANSAKHGVS